MKRFAAHVLMFDCENKILKMIENCAPFVEKIYVAYSELPWTYNSSARDVYRNSSDKNILKESIFRDKIELIEGTWETEIAQRNECLKRAKNDKFDYLIIQDADEFYSKEAYQKNIMGINQNPGFDLYTTNWYVFWKSLDYVLVEPFYGVLGVNPAFAINCQTNAKFDSGRRSITDKIYHLDGVCHHLAYVMDNESMYRKISTWGHSHQFNRDSWYYRKWLRWTPQTKNLHPLTPSHWKKAVPYSFEPLPKEIMELKLPISITVEPSFLDIVWDQLEDFKSYAILSLKNFKKNLIQSI